MNAGDKFTFEGKEYAFWKDSGETHFFAQELGNANTKIRRIAYEALIAAQAAEEEMNPRFVAFQVFTDCVKTGAARNAFYMAWIADAVAAFAKLSGAQHSPLNPFRVQNHEAFTKFILTNGRAWS